MTIKEFYAGAVAYGNKPKEFIIATTAFAAEMGRFFNEGEHCLEDDTWIVDGIRASGALLRDLQSMFNVAELGRPIFTDAEFTPNDDGFFFKILMQIDTTENKNVLEFTATKSISKQSLIFTKTLI